MFRGKPSILIPELYLYGIKYKPILNKFDRKIRGKIINFFKRIFLDFVLLLAGPGLTILAWAGAARPNEQWRVN
jgi:hypothetical protein